MDSSDGAVRSQIANELLRIGAVSLSPSEPFTWASGRLSPVYCDNRLSLGYPSVRELIAEAFEQTVRREHIPCDVIVGTATAGIPHSAWLAQRMGLPMAYVRSSAKGHGKGNQIEGLAPRGAKAIVIEDLVSTGMSSTAVLAPLSEAGVEVTAVLAIFTYGLEAAQDAFQAAKMPLYTLSDFPTLIQEAEHSGTLTNSEIVSLEAWYQDPARWSLERGGK
jgi:orotate phosphoribosyltransferase